MWNIYEGYRDKASLTPGIQCLKYIGLVFNQAGNTFFWEKYRLISQLIAILTHCDMLLKRLENIR